MDNNLNPENPSQEIENNVLPDNPVTPKKKVPYALIFGIGGGLLAIILIVTGIFVFKFLNTPKAIVARAAIKTLASASNPVLEDLDTKELNKTICEIPYCVSISASIDEVSGLSTLSSMEGAGFNIVASTDYKKRQTEGDLAIQWGGSDLIDCEYYCFDDILGIACPNLYDGYLSANVKTIGEDYTNSIFYDPSNPLIEPDESWDDFEKITSDSFFEIYKKRFPEDYEDLIENITIEKNDDPVIYDFNEYYDLDEGFPENDSDKKNKKYFDVTISNEDAQTILENSLVILKEKSDQETIDLVKELQKILRDDVIILVGIDGTGRICELHNNSTLTAPSNDSELETTASVYLNGEEDSFSSMVILLGSSLDSELFGGVSLTRNAEKSDNTFSDSWEYSYITDQEMMDFEGTCTTSYDFEKKAMDVYADINFTDDSDYCLNGTINFDDLKKGKSISAELSDCYIESSSDDFVISLSRK